VDEAGGLQQLTDVVSQVFRSRLVVTATRRPPSNCSFRCGRTTGHNVVIHSFRRPAADRPAQGGGPLACPLTDGSRSVDGGGRFEVTVRLVPGATFRGCSDCTTALDSSIRRYGLTATSVAESMPSLGAVMYRAANDSARPGRSLWVLLICLFNQQQTAAPLHGSSACASQRYCY